MKIRYISLLLLLLFAPYIYAQSPQTTTITGTLYWGDGTPAANAKLQVTKVVRNGVIVSGGVRALVSDASGQVSFNVLRGATITIKADAIIGASDLSQGVDLVVPDASTATLESMAEVAQVPDAGLTIKVNNTLQPNKAGTLDFGSGFLLTESPTGEQNISVSVAASDLPSGINSTKIGDGSVSNTEFQYLDGVSSAIQSQVDSKASSSDLTDEASARAAADTTLQEAINNIDLSSRQPLDSDLTAIAGLTPANDDIIQRKAGAWTNRTMAQLKSDLALTKNDVGLSGVPNVDATNASNLSSGTVPSARLSLDASDIPTLTSAKISDFNTAVDARISYPVSSVAGRTGAVTLTKSDVGLSSVVNADTTTTANITDSVDKRFTTDAQRTVIQNTSGTNTGDQTSVTGNAGTATKLLTARNIDGQSFDGSADITVIAPGTHAATSKAAPVDADEMSLVDSAASNILKKLTWVNLKATLKTYFDTLYQATGSYAPATSSTAILKGNGSGGFSSASAGTDYQAAGNYVTAASGKTATFSNSVTVAGTDGVTLTGPATNASVSGVLNTQFAATSNSGSGETDIYTYTLPAGALNANGKALRVRAWGTKAANGNGITWKLYFGSTAVVNKSATTSGAMWFAEYTLIRTGAATQTALGTGWSNSGANATINVNGINVASPTETLSGTVTIKLTLQGVSSADATAAGWAVEILN
jgi:hypothetical protein